LGSTVFFFSDHLQCSGVSDILFHQGPHFDCSKVTQLFRMADIFMQWEYKLVALGLLVDATEPHQREKHEDILNGFGREGWEAVAYAAQSDTVLLKRPVMHTGDERKSGSKPDSTAETT
jgi:hypothetical protein